MYFIYIKAIEITSVKGVYNFVTNLKETIHKLVTKHIHFIHTIFYRLSKSSKSSSDGFKVCISKLLRFSFLIKYTFLIFSPSLTDL